MSAPAAWANAQKVAQSGHPTGVKSVKWVNQKNIISSGELLSINSRFCGGYSELPYILLFISIIEIAFLYWQ
jgi:hypothetical protein